MGADRTRAASVRVALQEGSGAPARGELDALPWKGRSRPAGGAAFHREAAYFPTGIARRAGAGALPGMNQRGPPKYISASCFLMKMSIAMEMRSCLPR